jgi:hypothetical protein
VNVILTDEVNSTHNLTWRNGVSMDSEMHRNVQESNRIDLYTGCLWIIADNFLTLSCRALINWVITISNQ